MTPVEEPGTNTITKFEWNAEENKLTAVHYRVDLTKTEYGHKDAAGATAYYYKWTDNGNGLEFEQTSDPSEAVITYYADPNRLAPDRITADQSGNPIDNDFVGNYVSGSGYAYGGAIYNNKGEIGDITGDFIGTYISSTASIAYGGAISNYGTICDITGDFIGNYASSSSSYAYGGAIYNDYNGTIGDITGDFIGNYASSPASVTYGGAIYNNGTIGNITGGFIGNYSSSYYLNNGGAIYNGGTISNITGDFIGNYAVSSAVSYMASGGAINNRGAISNITGDFIGNYTNGSSAYGGAIYNDYNPTNIISNITGDFIGNYATASDSAASGGAIYNNGIISDITGDFIGNYASFLDSNGLAHGGAIYNSGIIGDITGDFIRNYVSGPGAGVDSVLHGGAIYNTGGRIGDIIGDFIENYVSGSGSGVVAYVHGGAIYNYNGAIGSIAGDFIGNNALAANSIAYGGAIYNNYGTIGKLDDSGNLVGGIYGSFINNYAKTESEKVLALGGAVYTDSDMNFIADNQTNYFSGNYTEDSRGKINNAIFVETSSYSSPTIKLQAQNNGAIVFDDQIDGGSVSGTTIDRTNAYNLAITGDSTGRVILNNDVINAKVDLNEVTLQLGREDVLNQSQSLALNSGTLSLLNNGVGTMHLPELSLNGAVNMAVDADLANKTMDRITADKYNISQDSKLNVNLINLISDAKEDKTDIEFADSAFSNNVSYTGDNPIAYSKIYKYDVSYNPEDGYFTFLRGSSGNPSDNFNPTVLSPAVTNQAAGYSTQMQVFNYAFQHSDSFMNIPYMERLAYSHENQYALINDSTIGPYSPIFTRVNQGGAWFKPYVSFENIPLKNGPTVDNIAYGSLIGYDSKLTPIKYGFERVLTGYVGYNGASQSYPGVDTYQNGGLLGGTVTLYKGNFFNATTLSAGANVGESSNMYGHENYTMLLAGIGNKLGYNFEFQRGRYILQPSMLMSYTFVNTFDYTNSAGTRMTSDPLHAIQLSPGLKFIMNTKNGWQPYAAVNMVWNIFTDQNAKADNISLPNMSIKPYVQYGLGVQKLIKDKFLAFGQALVSNGGRNGISFSFGLRWLIGRE